MLHIHWIKVLSDLRILKECAQWVGTAIAEIISGEKWIDISDWLYRSNILDEEYLWEYRVCKCVHNLYNTRLGAVGVKGDRRERIVKV